jgi:mono/diheme cytochrome c family protein
MKLLLLTFFLTSCVGQTINSNTFDDSTYAPPAYDTNTTEGKNLAILQSQCATCHAHAEWSSFTSAQDYINYGYIVEGDSSSSFIITRLKNEGGNMPQGSSMSDADYQSLKSWIDGM